MASSIGRPGPGAAPLESRNGPASGAADDAPSASSPTSGASALEGLLTGLDGILTADRRRLLETQQIARIGSWDWYVDADAIVWTPELFRIHGIEPDDFDGTYDAYMNLVHPDDRASSEAAVKKALETKGSLVHEHRIVWPNGEIRTLETRAVCDLDAEGRVAKLTGTCQDITHHLRAQEELREAHERYRSLIEAIPAISYIDSLRPRVKTIYVSPQLSDILGFDASEVSRGFWIERVHPDDREEVATARANSYERGEDFSSEYRVIAADGRTVWISDQAAIVRDEEGHPIFAQGIMYDVTERKRLEDQLVQSHKMDALGRLSGGIAHDFNNLLTAILGNTQLLLDDPETPASEVRAGVIEIQEAAMLGADLVRQLLAFTRPTPRPSRVVDLSRVVASTEGLLRRVISEDVVLETRIAAGPLPTRLEEAQLTQVVMNLVVNAREAMPDGGRILLEVFVVDDVPEDEGSFVVGPEFGDGAPVAVLRVTDSGPGIEEAMRPMIFEPFFSTKREGARGTGLGLANVYALVTRAGGRIGVSSGDGRGTAIAVYLPLQPDAADEIIVLDAPRSEPAGEVVLVVEDDQRVRRITASLLERSGYRVLEAADGVTGLEIFRRDRVDAVVTDVVMPEMDGKTLAGYVHVERPEVGVVFMSGYAEQLEAADLDRDGVAYIQKPFTREELESKLSEVLAVKGRELT